MCSLVIYSHCCETPPELFDLAELKLYTHKTTTTCFPLSPALGDHHSLLLYFSTSLSLNVFKVHPCCSVWQGSFPCWGWVMVLSVCVYNILLIHSSVGGHLDCFRFLPIMCNAAVDKNSSFIFILLGLISKCDWQQGRSWCWPTFYTETTSPSEIESGLLWGIRF